MKENKLWFRAKRYGWGWYPITWQGWVVVLWYVAIVIGLALTLDENSSNKEVAFMFVLPMVLAVSSLIMICYKKGEKPGWRWGRNSGENKKEEN